MAYAITQTCCNDASCVSVCPVNCIHPTPDEPDFGNTDMLYIDPAVCIDCGACADACPVDAIFPVDMLTGSLSDYADINAAYYSGSTQTEQPPAGSPTFHTWTPPVFDRNVPSDLESLDVAVVGTGPAGMYTVEDLLLHTNARVTLIDRLEQPGGLIRYGVAPDHPSTKRIGETFARFYDYPRLRMRLGVEVGKDLTVDELAGAYDAVVYAVGASTARSLGVRGEQLPGSATATSVVAWYNGHPEAAPDVLDLSAERVVLVGNGNVALDVARILTTDPERLAGTSISEAALDRLRSSKVREVVLLARRGPESAAYTRPELLALTERADARLIVDTHDPAVDRVIDDATGDDKTRLLQRAGREAVDWSAPPPHGQRRIVLRFNSAPVEFLGDTRIRGLRVTGTGGEVDLAAGQVVRAVGYHGTPLAGLPFDETTGTVPHTGGRVAGREATYVVGWIKRGPSGGIGANRECARETVGTLLEDAAVGRMPRHRRSRGIAGAVSRTVRGRRAARTG